ncbi:unnamed protein product, partial [Didymodactylos carnosus]
TNDSIFEELVETGIVIPPKPVRLSNYIGDYQYLAETIRYAEKEPMPSLLDCRQLVVLQIILPLGSKNVHLNLSSKRSVLLVGPKGSGKEFLIHIACNEVGGLLVDLSPANLKNSYSTTDGLKVLLAMVKRLSPVRLKRKIRAFMKKFKSGERVMLVGTSSQPYRARLKQLLQVYERIILFPRPNYGSRRKIWFETLIEKYSMKIIDVELSILASVSNGYTAGQILETIKNVVNNKKLNKYNNNVCKAEDFIPILSTKTPVFIDEENKLKMWYKSTPLGRLRQNNIAQVSVLDKQNTSKNK